MALVNFAGINQKSEGPKMDPNDKHYVSSIFEQIIVDAIIKDLDRRPHSEVQELMKADRCDHITILARNIYNRNQEALKK